MWVLIGIASIGQFQCKAIASFIYRFKKNQHFELETRSMMLPPDYLGLLLQQVMVNTLEKLYAD